METVVYLIEKVGFPIVLCGFLLLRSDKTHKETSANTEKAIKEFSEKTQDNSILLAQLIVMLGGSPSKKIMDRMGVDEE